MLQEEYRTKVEECLLKVNSSENIWEKYEVLRSEYSLYVNQNRSNIKIAVVGKAPFPTAPEGIPFCRETWDKQANGNCSGKTVLETMFNTDIQALSQKFETPIHFFFWLVSQGIVFLNRFQEDALTRDIVNELSAKVILCGNDAHELSNNVSIKILHPSRLAAANNLADWENTWSTQDQFIAKMIQLDEDNASNIKACIHDVCQKIQHIRDDRNP